MDDLRRVGEYRPREQGLRQVLASREGWFGIRVGEYRPREQGLRLISKENQPPSTVRR